MSRERALALLDECWAAGSKAANSLILRGELLRHLIAMEGERNGRVIIDTFIARIEAAMAETQPSHSPTLYRHALAQLCVLRRGLELAEREAEERG